MVSFVLHHDLVLEELALVWYSCDPAPFPNDSADRESIAQQDVSEGQPEHPCTSLLL